MTEKNPLSLAELHEVARRIEPYVLRTPTVAWPVPVDQGGPPCELYVKLELLQRTGSFKARAAINVVQKLLAEREPFDHFPGVTAYSAGNHAIATAYAARTLGTCAKVVMPRTANTFRMDKVRAFGAELVLGNTISDLISLVQEIQSSEGRVLVHPFEGLGTAQGTATVALELCQDVPELDAIVIPVGGGGLIAGMSAAIKQLQPACRVIGVEPEGADGMRQSLDRGAPMETVDVKTIADSLGAPMHAPLSFALVRDHVDQLVTVSDDAMREAMRQMFTDLKLAAEPACAAALAALNGPLASSLKGKRVALIACGSNIDLAGFTGLLATRADS